MTYFFATLDAAEHSCREASIFQHMDDPLNAKRVVSSFISAFENHKVRLWLFRAVISSFTEFAKRYSLSYYLQNEVEGNLDDLIVGSCTILRRLLCSGPPGLRQAALETALVNIMHVKGYSDLFITG